MNNDPYRDRKHLTFEQAEGVEPLPSQLQLKELSPQLRARLWLVILESMEKDCRYPDMGGHGYMTGDWQTILYDNHVKRESRWADEFENRSATLIQQVKSIFVHGEYSKVFGFIQFVLRHRNRPSQLDDQIAWALSSSHAAYRVLEGRTIIPISSGPETTTVEKAIADLATAEFRGARRHLLEAASKLTEGDCAGSIRESISAVESVARTLAPSGKFSDAMAKLEAAAAIHRGLKAGFTSIYGYTSDEKGLRHPLLDDANAKVDEVDALFMIGACAAFVSYMINKARQAGLVK